MAQAVRTLRARPAVSWRTSRRVVGFPWPYRGLPLGRVAACTGRVTGRVSRCVVRHVIVRPRALLLVVSQASSTVSRAQPAVSWPCQAVSRPPPGAPRPACLLSLLCACSACCVPAQPAVCLLNLLCATIQPAVL